MADNAYILEADPSRQKCTAIRVHIEDTTDETEAEKTYAVTALALYVGVKKGLWKGEAARRLT